MDNVIVYLQVTCPTLGIYLGGVMTYEGGHVLCPKELRADLLATVVIACKSEIYFSNFYVTMVSGRSGIDLHRHG